MSSGGGAGRGAATPVAASTSGAWRSYVPVPTRRAVVAAGALAPVVLVLPTGPVAGLVVLNGLLLLVLGVDAALAPRPAHLRVDRQHPASVPLDGEADVEWRLHNPTPRPASVRLADAFVPSLRADDRRARLRVAPRGSARAATRLRPSRRGRFPLHDVAVRVAGPLGLASRQETLEVPGVIRVYPSFRSRREAELRIERARILEVGLRSARGRGGGTEFDSLREYVEDDEFRRIDWAATARSGKAIVREYRAERNQTVVVLLDTGRTMAARVPDRTEEGPVLPRLDHAMDAAMALTTVASHLGDRVGLVAFGAGVRAVVPPSGSRDQLRRVTEAMFELEPELVESDYRTAFLTTLARFRKRALLVLLTELAEEALTEVLLPALPLVARHHLMVVGSVADPRLEAWAHLSPQHAGAAYRKAAATRRLAARRDVRARLARFGVRVADAPPGDLPGRLVDTYLDVKAVAGI